MEGRLIRPFQLNYEFSLLFLPFPPLLLPFSFPFLSSPFLFLLCFPVLQSALERLSSALKYFLMLGNWLEIHFLPPWISWLTIGFPDSGVKKKKKKKILVMELKEAWHILKDTCRSKKWFWFSSKIVKKSIRSVAIFTEVSSTVVCSHGKLSTILMK